MNDKIEIWKSIPEYEGLYEISNLGRVKSLAREVIFSDGRRSNYKERILKYDDNRGYYVVKLSRASKSKAFKIHRLVAQAFIPNEDLDKDCVNHINGDKKDNSIENLEWCTKAENTKHAFKTNLIERKLSKETVKRLRELYSEGLSYVEIAKQLEIDYLMVYKIINNKIYRDY